MDGWDKHPKITSVNVLINVKNKLDNHMNDEFKNKGAIPKTCQHIYRTFSFIFKLLILFSLQVYGIWWQRD